MINYSLSKRAVRGMESEGTQRTYAFAQTNQVMDIGQFSEHIASHGSVYSEDIIEGVLKKAVTCMVEKLKEGYKIRLGALGAFYPTIVNKPWRQLPEEPKDFNPSQHISGLNVVWEKGSRLLRLGDGMTYNPVPSRIAQAATLKAEKEGLGTVDLAAAKNPSSPTVPPTGEEDESGTSIPDPIG